MAPDVQKGNQYTVTIGYKGIGYKGKLLKCERFRCTVKTVLCFVQGKKSVTRESVIRENRLNGKGFGAPLYHVLNRDKSLNWEKWEIQVGNNVHYSK
jgi:hypothetical protein